MLENISRRAIGSHVSFTAIRVSHALLPSSHHHRQHPRTWPDRTPRTFTSTSSHQKPTQSPNRKLNVFVPPNATSIDIETQSTTPQAVTPPSEVSSHTTPLPTLKPITTHYNLPTYQTHHRQRLLAATDPQTRHKLNISTVHLGTRYEYLIQSHLQAHLGFTLTRIGGKGDGGVDLIGTWTLPIPVPKSPSSFPSSSPMTPPVTYTDNLDSPRSPDQDQLQQPTFRILLQAKRMSQTRKPMPALMRELDGAILSAASARWISAAFLTHNLRTSASSGPASNSTSPSPHNPAQQPLLSDLSHLPTLGILVTTRPLTPGIEQAMASSPRCLMYVCLEEVDGEHHHDHADVQRHAGSLEGLRTPSTRVRQMAWNAAATRAGLRGYEVVSRFSDRAADDGSSRLENSEAVLIFQGQPLSSP